MANMTTQEILQGIKDWAAPKVIYDISAAHNNTKYTDLADALGTDGENIPQEYRKGGITVRFVRTSDNKYIQARLMADEFTTDTTQWAIAEEGVYVENPEFVYVKTDAEDKILWAIKANGDVFYGAGVPSQVVNYINEKIAELSLDEYEDIVAFLNDLEKGDKTLQTLLNEKVDKEEGKSLIDSEYASVKSTIDNTEFLEVTTDSEDKILEGIQADGTKVIGGDLKVLGNMKVSGVSYKVIENPEYLAAWVDAEDKVIFGFKTGGKVYVGDADFLNDIKNNQEAIDEIKSYLANFDNLDIDALSSITAVENPEFIEAKTDSENKILAGRTPDGAAFENVGFTTPKVSIDGHTIENFEDSEERTEITTDAENKLLSYRKKDGTKVETTLEVGELYIGKTKLDEYTKNKINADKSQIYNLPKYGTVDILEETFYLTKDSRASTINDVYIIQDIEDTEQAALDMLTIANYYIKSTLTDNGDGTYSKNSSSVKLDFYAASKVSLVNSSYYVSSTLVNGQPTVDSIEVSQYVGTPDVRTWPVDKKTEHQCVVNIDFGHFLNGNFYVYIKFQGSSTLKRRKKNFRFTFYKNASYNKKNKIKIGEMVRLSGFNLKSNFTDSSRVKELLLYRIILQIYNNKRNMYRYPWEKDNGVYTGATGIIKGFPIRTSIGGVFYGMQTFNLKKDEKNYMLNGDDDHSGIFVCGTRRDASNWTSAKASDWEDEMMDEMSQETADALNEFFDFINGRLEINGQTIPFNENTALERMGVDTWIDYLICLQCFDMWDSVCRNLILYAGSDKKKFYAFFYDLDLSMSYEGEEGDFFDRAYDRTTGVQFDMSLWANIRDFYWDRMMNRYYELRNSVLSDINIINTYNDIINNIPSLDFIDENAKWGTNASFLAGENLIRRIQKRLLWIDNNYFV